MRSERALVQLDRPLLVPCLRRDARVCDGTEVGRCRCCSCMREWWWAEKLAANYPKAQYSKGVPRNFPKGGLPGDLPRAHPDIAQRPSNVGAHPQTQPLSNSGTVLLETARNGYAPITYSLTREEHAPNTAPPAPTATDTGVWPQPEPQLIQLKLSY